MTGSPVSGKLIAVEGLDGSGKSTQIYLLKRWLELRGYKVFFTEWNSSTIVRRATRRGKKRQLLTPTTFSLIHCTDFADRYDRTILPLLHSGAIVLADRYVYTAFARDAPGRVVANHLEALNHCPTTRAVLRQSLEEKDLASKVSIPEDGETVTVDREL